MHTKILINYLNLRNKVYLVINFICLFFLFLSFPEVALSNSINENQIIVSKFDKISNLIRATDIYTLNQQEFLYQSNSQEIMLNTFNIITKYDPVILSVTVSQSSKFPKPKNLKNIMLNTPTKYKFFEEAMAIVYREGHPQSNVLLVIFPGAFATLKRGSYRNLIIESIDKEYLNAGQFQPHIISFPGLYTETFLDSKPTQIPWNLDLIAKDIHERIQNFVLNINTKLNAKRFMQIKEIGQIGSSGGASLALAIQNINESILSKSKIEFNLGTVSLSPILDGFSAFRNLDQSFRVRSQDTTLTKTFDAITLMINTGLSPSSSGKQVLEIANNFNPEERKFFAERFFNEFFFVDLKTIVAKTGKTSIKNEFQKTISSNTPYYDYFVIKGCESAGINTSQCEYLFNVTSYTQHIKKAPVFLFFADDDPVLSDSKLYSNAGFYNSPIKNTLNKLSKKSNFFIYNPKLGAHVGILGSTNLSEIIGAFFISN